MPEKLIRLSNRLMTVAGFIEKGADVADVGTDHGYLPVYLAQSGLARSIIASDKSADSLGTALKSAAKYGVTEKISFRVAPGLSGISEDEADTIVIAGMGGETIIGILEEAPWTRRNGVKLVLQPQTKLGKLCVWLYDNGYRILDASPVRDRGRPYVVLLCLSEVA